MLCFYYSTYVKLLKSSSTHTILLFTTPRFLLVVLQNDIWLLLYISYSSGRRVTKWQTSWGENNTIFWSNSFKNSKALKEKFTAQTPLWVWNSKHCMYTIYNKMFHILNPYERLDHKILLISAIQESNFFKSRHLTSCKVRPIWFRPQQQIALLLLLRLRSYFITVWKKYNKRIKWYIRLNCLTSCRTT